MENNKPNLILLNGPLGVGKSTLAKMYSERNPLALNLDIDLIRMDLGQWREHKEESAMLSLQMAIEMGRIALSNGCDVVVAQIVRNTNQIQLFEKLAKDTGAQFHEVLLYAPKEESVDRFIKRGRKSGFELGYRPDGLIGRSGGIAKVEEMYDEMMDLATPRKQTVVINSVHEAPESTYTELLSRVTEPSL